MFKLALTVNMFPLAPSKEILFFKDCEMPGRYGEEGLMLLDGHKVNDSATERKNRMSGEIEKALRKCRDFQPNALKIFRKHKFVFRGKGGRWEKLAFTLYTDLCEIHWICDGVLKELSTRGEGKR